MSGTDLTFITNEGEHNLLERFKVLIKDTEFFDALVGYFYSSGFYALYKPLEHTKKIRILVGIKTDRTAYDLLQQAQKQSSYGEVTESFQSSVTEEVTSVPDHADIEDGITKFIEWISQGKLEIRAFPAVDIHAKLYILTFTEGDRDVGRVITGSSNFSRSGLSENLEFNVELKNPSDYQFAKQKFEELWETAIDVSEDYVATVQTKTWLNNTISPYELYLKFLYEYFKEKINLDQEEIEDRYRPERFMDLEYQREAVWDAKAKLDEYGGVFLSDVVGLGKTYVAAMLAQQLDGRNLVLAPPILIHKSNPGSWKNIFDDFRIPARFESLGKLDQLAEQGTEKYKNIFIDEAHRFRTETTASYEKLAQICRGKRVILVTATPLNNTPKDILSQIKLFQYKSRNSTIPGLPDLELFFNRLESRLKGLDRAKDQDKYVRIAQENAREIRDRVLKYLMVRRTRREVEDYFSDDLQRQDMGFPTVLDPEPIFYEFDNHLNQAFEETLQIITGSEFKYARYTPLLYYEGEVTQPEELAQRNMGKFMKILLVKRLESSFYAFRQTLDRFIRSYELYLEEFDRGNVYTSKKYTNRIFELIDSGDEAAIQALVDEDRAQRHDAKDFRQDYRKILEADLAVLEKIKNIWSTIENDPKLEKFQEVLESSPVLKENKIIVFTESKETAEYLGHRLKNAVGNQLITYTGQSSAGIREQVIENFDANAQFPKDDGRVLISTEVLSEGVNLHRSNVVINYDIPWNPTRLVQRVGRINRIDSPFDEIYTFNFFPTVQSNDILRLKEAAEVKISSFIEMLGNDAKLLTDGEEIKSHDLFSRLTSRKTITGEDEETESELEYLQKIRQIRDSETKLFDKIKRLPKKARTARHQPDQVEALLTYFRKGKLQKFFLSTGTTTEELDFLAAAKSMQTDTHEERAKVGKNYYDYLEKSKTAFKEATLEEALEPGPKGRGRSSEQFVLQVLKSQEFQHFAGFTEDDEEYSQQLIRLLAEGGIPKQTTKVLAKKLKQETNPLKILGILRTNIAPEFFREAAAESAAVTSGPREVILSEYFAE